MLDSHLSPNLSKVVADRNAEPHARPTRGIYALQQFAHHVSYSPCIRSVSSEQIFTSIRRSSSTAEFFPSVGGGGADASKLSDRCGGGRVSAVAAADLVPLEAVTAARLDPTGTLWLGEPDTNPKWEAPLVLAKPPRRCTG